MNKYSLDVRWSDEDEGYIALSPEFPGVSAFGETVEEAVAELQVARKLAIETYQAEGWPLPAPRRLPESSGKLLVRMPKTLHGRLVQQADTEGVSLNTLVVTLLSEGMGLGAGLARAERTITKVLHGWSAGFAQAIAVLASRDQTRSGTLRILFGEEQRGLLSEVPIATSQVHYLQRSNEVSSPKRSR